MVWTVCKTYLFEYRNVFWNDAIFFLYFPKIHRSVLRKIAKDLLYFLRRLWRESLRKKIAAEVRIINFIILRKKQWTHMKTKQFKQDILNQ